MAANQTFTDIEKEVVVLTAVHELISSIVNFEILTLGDSDPTEVRFESSTHAKFFNLVMVDLLSKMDVNFIPGSESYLSALGNITKQPHFNTNDSIASLQESTCQFRDWLNRSFTIDEVWLPTIEVKVTLELTRFEVIKIAGNICRHNFLRAAGIAEEVRQVLARAGVNVRLDEALIALSDVNEWLHTHVFHYHSSTIAEFLNNIRWGIYRYLQPEFSRSIVWESRDPPKYRFTYPDSLESPFAKECYWDLLNRVRTPPYMRPFLVTEWIKKRY